MRRLGGVELVLQDLNAVGAAPELALLVRRPALDRLVVPLRDVAERWVDRRRHPPALEDAPRLGLAGPGERQARIDGPRAHDAQAAMEVRDVAARIGEHAVER